LVFGRYRLLVALVALAVCLDQGTKALAAASIPPDRVIPVIDGILDLRLRHNHGVAWGLGADLPARAQRALFPAAAALIGAGLLGLYLRLPVEARARRVAVALVLGGGAGNFVDRIRFGYVVDFIASHLSRPGWTMSGTFNLADVLMVGGFVILAGAVGASRDRRGRVEAEGGSN
jgi:signal peptidase II